MGNSSCACMSTKENPIKAKKNSQKMLVTKNNYTPIMIALDTKEDGIGFLQTINFQFCTDNSIGPFYLNKYEELFSDSFKEKNKQLSLELIRITHYNEYITNLPPTGFISEYHNYYLNSEITKIKTISIERLQCHLIYCTSSVLRLPLYLSFFSTIPFLKYSNKHKNKIDSNTKIKEQIELDLPRTFPQIQAFKNEQFIKNFRSLLYEITNRDYSIGYVQGINFIAGFCLVLSGNQPEIALILFTKLFSLQSKKFKCTLREMYNTNFPLLMKYVNYFRELIEKYEKDIYTKLVEIDINDHLWVSKWILTVCLTSFDNEIVLKCWDIIIAKGIDYILFICLSISSFYKKELLATERLDQFMGVVGVEISLEKEQQKLLLDHIITKVENNAYLI